MKQLFPLCIFLYVVLGGCSRSSDVASQIPPPVIRSIDPTEKFADETRDVEIKGSNFLPKITRRLKGDVDFVENDSFALSIETSMNASMDNFALTSVVFVDTQTLKATVPAGIPPDTYYLTVTTPHGLTHTLADPFLIRARIDSTDTDMDTSGTDTDTGIVWDTATETAGEGTDPLAGSPVRIPLTFNNRNQAEDLVQFPVLVVLTPDRIDYSTTALYASDIRFFDEDESTSLPFEIEQWDPSGTSYIWVRVPVIDRLSDTDKIWLYTGRSTDPPPPLATAVWSAGFQAVYHLSSMGEATGSFLGAVNYGATDTSDAISHGQHFDGTQSHLLLGTELPLVQNAAECTLSAWVRPSPTQNNNETYIIGISVGTDGEPTILSRAALVLWENTDVMVAGRSLHTEDLQFVQSDTQPVQTGEWNHLVGVIDFAGNRMSTYVNGEKVAENTVPFAMDHTADIPNHTAVIGTQEDQSAGWFSGDIDEVRISNVARSDAWIAATYLALTDTFIDYGTPEVAK